MNHVAIIAEYNPFHSGHRAQFEMIRRQEDPSGLLILMSGDFVQRGEPAIIDKYRRARMALEEGADLVLELPPAYATGSAEIFAEGSVATLEAAGCVRTLAFGAECPDLQRLEDLAQTLEVLGREKEAILEAQRRGLSYAAALDQLLREKDPEGAEILKSPNNMLAVHYLRALRRQKSAIRPLVLPREGAAYGEEALPREGHASAGALRRAMAGGMPPEALINYLPKGSIRQLDYQIFSSDMVPFLSARLLALEEAEEDLMLYGDSAPGLVSALKELSPYLLTPAELVAALKSKAFTEARIRRFLLHLLLGIRREEQQAPPQALKILGLRNGAPLCGALKQEARLPLITKSADADPALVKSLARAHHIYAQMVWHRHGLILPDEYRQSPVIV